MSQDYTASYANTLGTLNLIISMTRLLLVMKIAMSTVPAERLGSIGVKRGGIAILVGVSNEALHYTNWLYYMAVCYQYPMLGIRVQQVERH
jgi:hypothetical protein